MTDLREAVSAISLARLRAAYQPALMTQAMLVAIESRYPPLTRWNREIEGLFYREGGPLAFKDRERCLIALLAQGGPPLSLAIHLYWGLMEGLEAEEICHTLTLAACYCGVPRLAESFPVFDAVARILDECGRTEEVEPRPVLEKLVDHFTGRAELGG